MMRFLLYISFFICCNSGSFNNLDNKFVDRDKGKPETGLSERNLASDNTCFQHLIIDDNIYFDNQSEDGIPALKTERRYHLQSRATKRAFHQDHPFCFNKSTDPFLELDIPPPFCS